MQDLKVVSVEHDALLVAADDGERFRIAIDDVLQSKLRQKPTRPAPGPKVSPREIQTQIRAGLSASEVAAATGAPLEYIQRFEGPVLAERDYIVHCALGVPVHTAMDVDPITEVATFGAAIGERLGALGATDASWTSWKDAAGGWIVRLTFVSRDIDHDARWSFEPKKAALAPINGEAVTLSQQGDITGAFVPRLRAVSSRAADSSRFDSGAFSDEELRQPQRQPERGHAEHGQPEHGFAEHGHAERHDEPDDTPAFAPGAIHRAVEPKPASSQTADLLEALRRRRGEREAAAFADDDDPILPSSSGMHLVGTPLPVFDDADDGLFPTAPQPLSGHPRSSRKGRVTMPSWDEIVFGARPEDDPA